MPYFAEVILPLPLERTFTYSITQAEYDFMQPGMRVAVPFGKSKIYTGLVAGLHREPPELYQAREIHQILDDHPIVTQIQLDHWQWIASYYMCALGDVYRSAMPAALLLESESLLTLTPGAEVLAEELSDEEFLVYQALGQQSSLRISEVVSILNKKQILPVIKKLMERGLIVLQEEITQTYKPKVVQYVRLSAVYSAGLEDLLAQLRNAERQREVILAYFQLSAKGSLVTVKELADTAKTTPAIVKALVSKGIFEQYGVEQDRVLFEDARDDIPELSDIQNQALCDIKKQFELFDVTLLHGVTSSGKTEIYTCLIAEALQENKQVLYLVPEIALTAQLVQRMTRYFGNKVAVYHSKYSQNERVEVWNGALEHSLTAQLIIGARSALFLPIQNLGLVIVDEEHEPMFRQQDPAPRYHARDAAIVLARMQKAKVLLGSATPALESYYNVEVGKYGLAVLDKRYGDVQLPQIELVDLKDKYFRKRMTGHFSDTLLERIAEALAQDKQVILFQNRRGFSPVVECITCGHVPQCRQCDVSLTYHKNKNQLRCHYCGYAIAKPTHCHACNSLDLTTKGFGTEQIQLELTTLLPNVKVGRMDQDTTRGKFGFEKIIDQFKSGEYQILVGTQMLAKGLDFNNVSLVGIMNADNMLYYPDFRAFERSYQMLAQVSGRAGRAGARGKVVIQTYNPNHNIIRQVTDNDFLGMYKEQLYERRIYKYPPFFKLVKLTLKHRDYERLVAGSDWLAEVLRKNLHTPVLGPEEPAVGRIRNEYIRSIMIKITPGGQLEVTKKTIRKILDSFESVAQYRAIKVTINVDVY
jgi:primosomal protein N' (replication factor Y) (superfamily II helicase)